MSSKKKKFEQQIQQNKINRVTSKNTKYNKKMSKSDENYIKGNYTKSVNQTVYGVKKNLAEGKKVHGYGDDYIDTKGMKRSRYIKKQNGENPYEATKLYVGGKPKYVKGGTRADGSKYDGFYTQTRALTKEEKESFKNTGQLYHPQYKKKKEYDLWGSHKGDNAEKFSDHFNLFTLDGMRTAKENQRKGKHLQNIAEYGKGFLKDTVGDLAFDALKGFGAIGSTVASGLGGVMEDATNVMSGIADQRHGIKDYTNGRINTIENLKENHKMLNETGWGLDFTKMLNDASDRATERQVNLLNKEGRYEDAKAFKEDKKKTRERDRAWLNSAGFVMDLLTPSTIEDKIGGAIKVLGKNSIKSFKEMADGTADLAVGFKAGASDDIFFSGKKGTTAIDKKLDNEYSKVLDNAKDTVKNTLKQNPKTQNIAKYLDVIDKPLKGQIKIDGRTLNKKYTQTKDGYVPKYVGENELYPIEKPTQKLSQQYSMFGKSNKIENVDKYAEKFIQKMDDELAHKRIPKSSNNVEEWARHVDNLSDEGYEKAMEYLKEHKPYIYDKLSRDEFAENLIDSAIDDKHIRKYTQDILDEKIADEKNHKWFTTENQRNFNNPEARRIQENNYNLLKSILKPKEVVSKTIKERKTAFAQGTKNFIDNLGFKHIDELKELSQTLKDATNLTDNISRDNVVKMLNDMLFKGDNVIRGNIPKSDLVNILNTLEDNVNYNITKQNKGFKFEYRKDGKPKTFYMTDRNGKPIPFDHPMYKYSPTATDGHFEDKMSAMTSYFNIAKKSEFEEPLKAYKKMLKEGRSLTPEQYKEYEKFNKMNEEWTRIYSELKDLEGSEYHKYAQDRLHKKPEVYDVLGELDKEETAQNLAKQKLDYIDNKSAYGSDPNATSHKGAQSTASPRVQAEMARMQDVKEFDHITQKYSTGNIKNQISTKDKIEYGKSIGLKYINTKYGIQIPKDKQTFKNVYSNKNVSNAIDNLAKLMNKEVTLTKGANYKEDYAKIRLLVEDNIRYLDNLGVDRNVYFNKIKEQKLKLLDAIKKDMQVGVNTRGTKPMSGTVKNTTKNIKNPLESFHVKINGKELNPMNELSMDDLQWQYLRTQGAKTIDELFDIPDANLAQRGDDIGTEIGSMLRQSQNNTPLDNVAPYIDDMEDIFDVDQYLSPETKSILNKDAITERSREFLERTKKDPKGKQLSFDGRTLNKKYTQLKNTPKDIVPYNTPLDEIADNGSEQVNILEYMFNKNKPKDTPKIAPNDVVPYNKQSGGLEGVSKTFENKGNTKFNNDVIELSDSQYKVYDELLSLGYDKDFAKKMAYNITSEKEYSEWLKTMGYNTGDGFEKLNEKLNMDSSEKIREQIANEKDVVKKRATLDPRTEERLKYYEENFGEIPKPRDFFDDIELPPGVDEDGVIIDATKTLNKGKGQPKHMGSYFKNKHIEMLNGEYTPKDNKLPTLEEFKKFFVGDVSKTGDNEIKDMYKRWLNSYKKGLTVYNPGWHVQNFFQNKGQNFLALGQDAFMPQTKAKNVLKQMNGKDAKPVNVFDAKNNRYYSGDEIAKLAQEFGVVDGLGEDVRSARGIFPKLETQIDNSGLMKLLEKNEQTARLHHFITQIERGMSPEQASKSVNKYLFDYSQKSNADKFINDYIDPFWTFHKNNARLMATSAIEHGGKLSKIANGKRNLEQGIPEEQQQNENSKYGKIQMPGTTIKDSVNGDNYNYLYKEGVMPDIEDAFSLSNDSFENKLNPILRLMLQQSRGEGNFGNKIVEEGEEPGWNEITKEDRFGEVMQELNPFMPTLAKTYFKSKDRQQKADENKQSQEMTDRQQLLDWINYITGNKGNYYRNLDF